MKKTKNVIENVFRVSNDEATVAVVSATVEDDFGWSLFVPIKRAVTRWIDETEEGKLAFESSSEDFNVGDLSCELGDEGLIERLIAEGIHNLKIETFSSDSSCWEYDDHLYEGEE